MTKVQESQNALMKAGFTKEQANTIIEVVFELTEEDDY